MSLHLIESALRHGNQVAFGAIRNDYLTWLSQLDHREAQKRYLGDLDGLIADFYRWIRNGVRDESLCS